MWVDAYNNNDISLDFELTTNCNAMCPQCARTDEKNMSKRKQWLPLIQVSLSRFKKWFPVGEIEPIRNFHFAGTYGDPGMCKDLLEIVQYIISNSKSTTISINTNGGMRDELFWWKIGAVGGRRVTIIFDIDGIDQEMHNFYRQNVKLDKVIQNMQATLETNANVKVLTVIFKHNQDYVDQIQQMCRDMGVEEFETIQGNAFKSPIYKFIDQFGNEQQLEQLTTGRDDSEILMRRVRDFRYVDETSTYNKVSCMAAKRNNIKVSANGFVTPCCHIAPGLEALAYYKHTTKPCDNITISGIGSDVPADIMQEFIDNADNHNLNNQSLYDIVNSEWYNNSFAKSLNDMETAAFGCRKICGYRD